MKKIIFILLLCIVPITTFAAEDTTSSSLLSSIQRYEPTNIVDMPTAGMLTNMHYSVEAQLVSNGGFYLAFDAALFKFLNLGLSYGGTGIIGSQTMNMQKMPGFNIKLRLINESDGATPAVALGFNSQGRGVYNYPSDQFEQLPPDVYIAASKSFKWFLGNLSIHAGVNYHLENKDNRGINVYAGIMQNIFKYATLAFEINPNLNVANSDVWKDANALALNGGVRFAPSDNVVVEVQFKDFLRNSKYSNEIGRYFGMKFISKF
jgi:opacity protein-like surface antigen